VYLIATTRTARMVLFSVVSVYVFVCLSVCLWWCGFFSRGSINIYINYFVHSIYTQRRQTCRFLAEVKRRKLQYFGHVVRADNLCTHILHGIITGNRRRGRPRRRWTDDIKQRIGIPIADCVQRARDRNMWRSVSVSVTSDPQIWGRTKAKQGKASNSRTKIIYRTKRTYIGADPSWQVMQ